MISRREFFRVAGAVGAGAAIEACLPPTITPAPTVTPTRHTSILPTPTRPPSPLATQTMDEVQQLVRGHSKLSLHVGNRPQGLDAFLMRTQPAVLYSLNNSPYAEIIEHSTGTKLIRRVQNAVWGRLPDQMWLDLGTPRWEDGARDSARYEAVEKTIFVPDHGRLNFVDYANLTHQDFIDPMNEPVMGDSGDYLQKAMWLNAWFEEWLTLVHGYGIKGCIGSFATGTPAFETIPYLAGAARINHEYGGIWHLHEYGIDGGMMDGGESGALRYRRFHDVLQDATGLSVPIVISEFSAGNGYGTGLRDLAWVMDAIDYGLELRNDPYLLGACAFQLDNGAESNIDPDALEHYIEECARVDWTTQRVWLPVVRK